jgi:hypothetical protein
MEPWILPAAEQLYAHREDIQSNFQKVYNKLLGEKSTIIITGLPGVGKTVLSDYLTDVAYKKGYASPSEPSTKVETRKTRIEKQRLEFKVIPGQRSPARLDALDEFFNDDETSSIDGVIHVVANGMSFVRSEFTPQLRSVDSLQEYQRQRFEEEIRDLNEVCDLIRKSFRNKLKPSWLLVAVTKVDLYYNTMIEAARDRYSIQGKSEFSNRIRTLSNQVGSDNFYWDALPFCGRLDEFTYGNQTYLPQLQERQRDHYIAQFSKKLVGICKANS